MIDLPQRIQIAVLIFSLIGSLETAHLAAQESTRRTEREVQAAIAFARDHHPELAELLSRLKSMDDSAYQRAIERLARDQQRLTRLRDNDSERYNVALKVWVFDSKIRLQAARVAQSDRAKAIDELRDLLQQHRTAKRQLLQLEQKRLQSRLKTVNEQIEQLDDNSNNSIDQELQRLIQRSRVAAGKAKNQRKSMNNSKRSSKEPPAKEHTKPRRTENQPSKSDQSSNSSDRDE